VKYSPILLSLFIGFSIVGCGTTYISDTLLPEHTIPISKDHILYDGEKVSFIQPTYTIDINPSTISGRIEFSYQELLGKTAIVEGEYMLHNGPFYILRLEDNSLIKIPSKAFLKVVTFLDL